MEILFSELYSDKKYKFKLSDLTSDESFYKKHNLKYAPVLLDLKKNTKKLLAGITSFIKLNKPKTYETISFVSNPLKYSSSNTYLYGFLSFGTEDAYKNIQSDSTLNALLQFKQT